MYGVMIDKREIKLCNTLEEAKHLRERMISENEFAEDKIALGILEYSIIEVKIEVIK